MARKDIKKEITITAPAHKVWEVLFDPASYANWAKAWSETAVVETDNWKEGSKIKFSDGSADGLVGIVTKNEGGRYMEITYTGEIMGGVENSSDESPTSMVGIVESYLLTETEGEEGISTYLEVKGSTPEEYYDMMVTGWDKALATIKKNSELK